MTTSPGLQGLIEPTLLLEIGRGPICPHCRLDTFDDWWHDKSMKRGFGITEIEGRLKCHGCGKFFHVERDYGGRVTSSARARAATPTEAQ